MHGRLNLVKESWEDHSPGIYFVKKDCDYSNKLLLTVPEEIQVQAVSFTITALNQSIFVKKMSKIFQIWEVISTMKSLIKTSRQYMDLVLKNLLFSLYNGIQ